MVQKNNQLMHIWLLSKKGETFAVLGDGGSDRRHNYDAIL